MKIDNELLEKLAELEHRQWSHWIRYMFVNLNYANLTRWHSLSVTSYDGLTEKEKESDREWARKVVDILDNHTNK